jgi:dipeptide/tripeptide permease
MGAWTTAMVGTMPLTGLLTGVVADALGARAGFAVSGVGLILGAAFAWRSLADGPLRPAAAVA